MGCAQSTEGVIHSSEPGSAPPNFTPSNVINIPVVPGWDGVPLHTQNVVVELELTLTWTGTRTSFSTLSNTIIAQAASGYKLSGVFLPVFTEGKQKGQPVDARPVGLRTFMGRAMCIFQTERQYPNIPKDTMFLEAPMTISTVMMSSSPEQVSGYHGLYGQLQHAGTQGYALSCVIDEPNARVSGWASQDTSVHLICQKPTGVPSPPVSQYVVINCTIDKRIHFGSSSASMPNLKPMLSTYLTQGHKISSVYNPPTVSMTGFTTTETMCHIILEKTHENYYFAVCDVPFIIRTKFGGSREVDHNQYLTYITAYSNNGWELAGLIDMPDMKFEGMTTFSSTVKMVFQAPAYGGGVGGNLGPP